MRYLYFLIIFLLFSCIPNAPHKNPLDPENPDATGTIKGEVITLFGSNPLPGALVHLFPGSHIDTTNSEGRFSFSPLQPNDYIVSVTKDMYISKADTVLLIGGEEKEIQFKLNGNLTIIDCSVYSVHSFDAYEEYEAVLTLTFFDPDVPFAESVLAESIYDTLFLQPKSNDSLGIYEKRIHHTSLSTIDTLIGISFSFWAKDLGGAYSDTVSSSLVRVIDQLPNIIFPADSDTISTGDTIRWVPPDASPGFYTLIKMWEFGGNGDNPNWMSDTLLITDSIYIFTETLKSGEYKLSIEAHDSYGDISRTINRIFFNQ